jgi:hypothetical protein
MPVVFTVVAVVAVAITTELGLIELLTVVLPTYTESLVNVPA